MAMTIFWWAKLLNHDVTILDYANTIPKMVAKMERYHDQYGGYVPRLVTEWVRIPSYKILQLLHDEYTRQSKLAGKRASAPIHGESSMAAELKLMTHRQRVHDHDHLATAATLYLIVSSQVLREEDQKNLKCQRVKFLYNYALNTAN
ncbi:hypothetical protein TNCV_325291 [Trichonephila clavipes]|nr:hypothetical protein TNCV_325291 [Trichonephila clavipes]